ncbi:MAG TPA: TlpA disulfide reductase family protein [Verrucomicrobiae bacterium]|nr:TlpA disulfide reductase family protein [Verrucomicrobiae bacterium]
MKPIAFCSLSLGLLAWLTVPAHAAESPKAPRYRLQVGQQLTYEGSSRFHYENGAHGTTDKMTFWVASQNGDGSWRIIARNENTFGQVHGKSDEPIPPGRAEEIFDAFDLYPDGRVANPPQGFREKGLPDIFFPMPADFASAQRGWQQEKEAGDKSLYLLAKQNDPESGKWVFERTDQGLFNEVYLSTSKAVIHFDGNRGLITRVESEYTQGYGFNGKGKGILELKSAARKDPQWIAQLASETDILLKAKAATRDALKAVQQGNDGDKNVAATEKMLRDGREKVKLPIVVAQFNAQLEQFKSSASYQAEEKKRENDVLNKVAADWSTVDIDGNKHSLAGYRGKVVVLDFWYRGCGWCIKAMPQIKEVVTHYEGKPVVVLGMNTDRIEKDARFVMDKLKLNYATLKAEGLPEKYGVQGFPTMIVIDQQGTVRGRHVGYSATLREDLIKQIDGLLTSRP